MNPATIPVRFSELKQFAKSPAHYLHAIKSGRDFGGSPAYRFGRLVHYLCLGGDFAVYDGVRRGKAWDAFHAKNVGRDIFTQSELDKARPVADAVLMNSDAVRLLDGEREQEISWTWLGRDCAGRLDVAAPGHIVDLKTTNDAHPERFQRAAMRYAYHAQLAWYQNGLSFAAGQTNRDCYIIAVESSPPYPVVIHRLTDAALEQGERLLRLWFEQLLNCESSGTWPGYAHGVVDFDVPDFDGSLIIDGEEVAA